MKKEAKEKAFLKNPVYKGGNAAMSKFVSEQVRYPQEAMQQALEGTVAMKYTIDHKGNVIDTKILTKLGGGLEEEAIRVVKLLKFDVPAHRGLKVLFHKDIQINFRLPHQVAAGEPHIVSEIVTDIQYTLTPSVANMVTENVPNAAAATSGGYNYTVSW